MQRNNLIASRNWILPVLVLLFVVAPGPVIARAETDSARVDRLFIWASDGNVRHRDLVDPAKDSLAQMGAKAAPWLARKLFTSDARERLTLADIFEKIGKVGTKFILPYLEADGEDAPRNAARCLERIKDSAAVIPLMAQMDHPEYSVRSQVALALGKTRHSMATDSLIAHLERDPDSDVRKSCAVAVGECAGDRGVPALSSALRDSSFAVRQSALTALTKLKSPADASASRTYHSPELARMEAYAVTVAECAALTKDDEKRAHTLLRSADPSVRGFAVEGLGLADPLAFEKQIADLKSRETDPFVRAQIARFEQIVFEKRNAAAKSQ